MYLQLKKMSAYIRCVSQNLLGTWLTEEILVVHGQLDQMILEDFPNLGDSVIFLFRLIASKLGCCK